MHIINVIRFLLLFLLLFISSGLCEEVISALPQTGGNRAFAMGGTYIASNKGINALYGNPAGLTTDNGFEFVASSYWQTYKKQQFETDYYSRYWYNDESSFSIEYDRKSDFNQTGLLLQKQITTYPVKIAGAVGLSPFYNFNNTRSFKEIYRYETSSSEIIHSTYIEKDKIEGLYNLVHIGIGISTDRIGSIGFSLNYPVNKQYKHNYNVTHLYKRNGNILVDDAYQYKDSQKVTASKFIRIGGILHLTSVLSIGILWNQSYHYNLEQERRTFPSTFNFGVAYRLIPNMLFAFDIQSLPWEKVKLDNAYLQDAKNGNSYRFGLEYGNKIILRGGYALDRLPILDSADNPVNLNNITLGIAYPIKFIVFDLGMRYRFKTFNTGSVHGESFDYIIRDFVIQSSIILSL